ncbi:MAG: hypothetical protein GX986_02670 [Firmicutes bacterium]|nr:hypothetical protein [Bacillota bacterium]
MATIVGIPRALAYYDYFPFWQGFFEGLGAETVTSPPTNKAIVDEGVRRAVDGTCFPVKILYGHVHWLMEKGVPIIFLPRLVSVAPREYICPKFMGLPDMVAAAFEPRPKMLNPTINLNVPRKYLVQQMEQVGMELGCSTRQTHRAFDQGLQAQRRYEANLLQGVWPSQNGQYASTDRALNGEATGTPVVADELRVGLLGHSYLIYDEYANMHMAARLRDMGVRLMTVDMLPAHRIDAQSNTWPKRMFWTSGRRILGAAKEYMELSVMGIIYVTAFACGTDSLTAELVERTVRRESIAPQLILNIDEHTGEAGILTRLEAFVDMLKWRANR